MKNSRLLLFLMLIVPWFTLPLLGKGAVKRYLPAGLFISLVVTIEGIIAKKQRWWWFYQKIHPKLGGEFPLIWGQFCIGSIWILKLTYGKLLKFILLNIIIDSFFTYFLTDLLKRLGIASLVRLKKIQLSLLFLFKSLLLYGFQWFIEKYNLVKRLY